MDITKDAKDTAQCEVRALNESYAIVGWKTLVVGPTEGTGKQTMRFDVNLRTESLATTAGVEECKIVKAPDPRGTWPSGDSPSTPKAQTLG